MFSRLAARIGARNGLVNTLSPSRSVLPSVYKLPYSPFSTTTTTTTTSTTSTTSTEKGVLDGLGMVPLAGLGAAYAISNEIYFLNEETVVAACFGAFVFIAYTAFGESVGKSLADRRMEIQKQFEGIYDEKIAAQEELSKAYMKQLDAAKDLDAILGEYKTLADKMAKAQDMAYLQQYNSAVNNMLGRLHNSEQNVLSAVHTEIATNSRRYVRAQYEKLPQKEKDKSVLEAIESLGGGPTPKSEGMKKLFASYVNQAKKQLTTDLKVVKFDETELKQAQERLDAMAAEEGVKAKQLPKTSG